MSLAKFVNEEKIVMRLQNDVRSTPQKQQAYTNALVHVNLIQLR